MSALREHIQKHWNRHYIAAKLRSDPLYEAVLGELRDSGLPLLDLGCGLGVLAFYLRDHGVGVPIHSFDYDRRKIDAARRTAAERGDDALSFDFHDARQGLPEHQGNVTILDILQFFTPDQVEGLLRQASERVVPGGKLIIRSCVRDDSWRFRATVAGDLLAKATLWMKAAPSHYPSAEDFQRVLSPFGRVRLGPLWGSTPFNNHLIVLERE